MVTGENNMWEIGGDHDGDQLIPVSSLSKLTGFPVDFIKKELLLEGEECSMRDLRASMLNYLQNSKELLVK